MNTPTMNMTTSILTVPTSRWASRTLIQNPDEQYADIDLRSMCREAIPARSTPGQRALILRNSVD